MDSLVQEIYHLGVHQRVCWQRPRGERTLVFDTAGAAVAALRRLAAVAREVEVYRAGESRYVVYVRD